MKSKCFVKCSVKMLCKDGTFPPSYNAVDWQATVMLLHSFSALYMGEGANFQNSKLYYKQDSLKIIEKKWKRIVCPLSLIKFLIIH